MGGVIRKFLLTPPMKMEKTVCSETSVYKIQQTKKYNLKAFDSNCVDFPFGNNIYKTATLLPHGTDIKGKSIIFIDLGLHNIY